MYIKRISKKNINQLRLMFCSPSRTNLEPFFGGFGKIDNVCFNHRPFSSNQLVTFRCITFSRFVAFYKRSSKPVPKLLTWDYYKGCNIVLNAENIFKL